MSCRFLLPFYVSIHAPHEGERRGSRGNSLDAAAGFNPRSPRGGATSIYYVTSRDKKVSIHAPHEGERQAAGLPLHVRRGFQSTLPTRGSDLLGVSQAALARWGFNPRSPRGGATREMFLICIYLNMFQSTLPTRGSDGNLSGTMRDDVVSIHAPHEGERL